MEGETPGQIFLLVSDTNHSIELDTDGHVPLEGDIIKIEPHFLIGVEFVTGTVRIKEALDLG